MTVKVLVLGPQVLNPVSEVVVGQPLLDLHLAGDHPQKLSLQDVVKLILVSGDVRVTKHQTVGIILLA